MTKRARLGDLRSGTKIEHLETFEQFEVFLHEVGEADDESVICLRAGGQTLKKRLRGLPSNSAVTLFAEAEDLFGHDHACLDANMMVHVL